MFNLVNRRVIGGIWVDARYSQLGLPFCDLPHVPGFPRLIDYNQPVPVPVLDGKDVIYRKEIRLDQKVGAKPLFGLLTYRIDCSNLPDGASVTVIE